MSSFVRSTEAGFSIQISDEGERIPFHRDMKVKFDDLGGAQVCLERRDGNLTCAALLPESMEPVMWHFDVTGPHVQNTRSPVPVRDAKSLQKLITDCRIGFNGKL